MAEYIPETFLETVSGRMFNFADPSDDMIDIYDIAHALGNICRYNGHTKSYLSVAEHCVLLCSKYAKENPDDPKTAMAFLMHDAAEAYLSDCPRPVKYTLDSFREAEAKIDKAIVRKFKLPSPMPAIIKEWDSRICCDERAQAMSKSGHMWGVDHLEPLGVKLQFWTPTQATDRFLLWYKALTV